MFDQQFCLESEGSICTHGSKFVILKTLKYKSSYFEEYKI